MSLRKRSMKFPQRKPARHHLRKLRIEHLETRRVLAAPTLNALDDLSINEDTSIHGTGTNLTQHASDTDSDESKLEFRISNFSEIDSRFGLSIGMDQKSGSFALRLDNSIHSHPASNFFGSTQVTIEVRDPEGEISNQQTFILNVIAVNDSPILDASADLMLPELLEDSGPPGGPTGAFVSSLISQDGALSNFSDVDGIGQGIAIVGKNSAIEKLWFSTDGGSSWQGLAEVSATNALVLHADATTRIYLETVSDTSGTIPDALTIKAWDQTGDYSNAVSSVDSATNPFSAQTDLVSLTVQSSPSSASSDLYAPLFDGTETFSISKTQLLANDTLGNGESIDTVTITTDATSTKGGTISVDGNDFIYTRPSSWFSGVDTFTYTLNDGSAQSTATVSVISGLNADTFTITLEPGRDHEVALQEVNNELILLDFVTDQSLLNLPRSLLPQNIRIVGAPNHSNEMDFEGLSTETEAELIHNWEYFGGSQTDSIVVSGEGENWAWLSSEPAVDGDLTVEVKQLTNTLATYQLHSIDAFTVEQFDRIEFNDPYLEIGSQIVEFDTPKPVNAPTDVTIAGGTLRSSSLIGFYTSESLTGYGFVDAPFAGGTGSLILAEANLIVGDRTDTAGFRTDGLIVTGPNSVVLLDANEATLGEKTVLGTEALEGALLSFNGFTNDFSGNIEGFGTIEVSQGDSGGPLTNNGTIVGTSAEQPLTINANVRGIGSFDNVVMNGEFTPGFSPALSKNGSVTYTALNRMVIEIGGREPGQEFDRVEHSLAHLGGTLDVRIIDGFQPLLGDQFEIITSEQPLQGSFTDIVVPSGNNGLQIRELINDNGIHMEAVFDVNQTLQVIKSDAEQYQIRGHNGDAIEVRGDRFRALVNGIDQFVTEQPWRTEQLTLNNGRLVQIATDGVNRLLTEGSEWKNFVQPSDINNDQSITALDALTVINELVARRYSDDMSSELTAAAVLADGSGNFYDQNGDGKCTALDALRVINDLVRNNSGAAGEGEISILPVDYEPSVLWKAPTYQSSNARPEDRSSAPTDAIKSYGQLLLPSEPRRFPANPQDIFMSGAAQSKNDAVDQLLAESLDWVSEL